ncbi:MAG: Uracil-DNA glycosylase, family 4 [uncultured Chloroflexia bacterium]|uniref:Type-4 uracil-DNA glycosylase n=1 Tax=uncultured Chloroflexia bacterium TaxID=1672391 RepID=A0A6J4HMF2_9CHLR|nr:MAG: Uracil-DNA glycosylase, family 4 [uncultured Chloroflexia bacterium]
MDSSRYQAMEQLRAQGLACTRCELYKTGTQVVWGEGNVEAAVMLIGQGPGETEDEVGRPFVGPAGAMLDAVLKEAGIDRDTLWITNTIKHWATAVERGRRVNRAPRVGEVRACRIWIEGELTIVQPKVLVCIGAPAAQAVIDRKFRISEERGAWRSGPNGEAALATFHPSYLIRLRSADRAAYDRAYRLVVDDFIAVAARAASLGTPNAPDAVQP